MKLTINGCEIEALAIARHKNSDRCTAVATWRGSDGELRQMAQDGDSGRDAFERLLTVAALQLRSET